MQFWVKWFIIPNFAFLSACTGNLSLLEPKSRTDKVLQIATFHGWNEHTIPTDTFVLKAYSSKTHTNSMTLTIYIEGDGLAFISNEMASTNPTPITPVSFNLAIRHSKKEKVAYLARPCQYVFDKNWMFCQPAYWTNARYSPEIINAMNQGIDFLKKYHHAKQLRLIGYSGGGTIATLIAAERHDVNQLMTIAAPLDLKKWTEQKSLTPLHGSLNPADVWKNIASIPQTHWAGGKDTIVPKEITFAFAKHFPKTVNLKIIVIPSFDHTCCWEAEWSLHLKS